METCIIVPLGSMDFTMNNTLIMNNDRAFEKRYWESLK